jgi:hypothetical protein
MISWPGAQSATLLLPPPGTGSGTSITMTTVNDQQKWMSRSRDHSSDGLHRQTSPVGHPPQLPADHIPAGAGE